MPSVDVVSKVDMQGLDNAINNVKREISGRFDFKNVKSEITLDRTAKSLHIVSADEAKVKTIIGMILAQCTRLKVDTKCLEVKEFERASQSKSDVNIKVKEGIPKETAQKMVKYIKSLNLKVQPAIQDDQIRITGKQIDDLQEIMRLLGEQDFNIPLQFVNMKR